MFSMLDNILAIYKSFLTLPDWILEQKHCCKMSPDDLISSASNCFCPRKLLQFPETNYKTDEKLNLLSTKYMDTV